MTTLGKVRGKVAVRGMQLLNVKTLIQLIAVGCQHG